MERIEGMTVAEVKAILIAKHRAGIRDNMEFRERVCAATSESMQVDDPNLVTVQDQCMERQFERVATRLVHGTHNTSLFCESDADEAIAALVTHDCRASGLDLDEHEIAIAQKCLRQFFQTVMKGMLDWLNSIGEESENEHISFWRYIRTVYEIATERSMLPVDVFGNRETHDEIIRRRTSRRQYERYSMETMRVFLDEDRVKEPFLSLIHQFARETPGMSDEECREMLEEFETQVLPGIRRKIEIVKPLVIAWVQESVTRIYGSMN